MPLGYDPQRPPGMFPGIDQLEDRVHKSVPFVLAAVGVVGGYFIGIGQDMVPVALCVGLGLVAGLLLVPILLKATSATICIAMVAAAALGTFWLLQNDAALKNHAAPRPGIHAAPAPKVQKLLNDLFPGGR